MFAAAALTLACFFLIAVSVYVIFEKWKMTRASAEKLGLRPFSF